MASFLGERSRLILSSPPALERRLGRLNGDLAASGGLSAFGLTFRDNRLPFEFTLGQSKSRFTYSHYRSNAATDEDEPTLTGRVALFDGERPRSRGQNVLTS